MSAGKVGDLETRALVRGLCSPLVVGFSFVSLVAVFFYDQVDFFWFRSLSLFLLLGCGCSLFPSRYNPRPAFSIPYSHGMPSPIERSCLASLPPVRRSVRILHSFVSSSSPMAASFFSVAGFPLLLQREGSWGGVGDRPSWVLMHRWMASFFDSSSLYYVRVRFSIGFGLAR